MTSGQHGDDNGDLTHFGVVGCCNGDAVDMTVVKTEEEDDVDDDDDSAAAFEGPPTTDDCRLTTDGGVSAG